MGVARGGEVSDTANPLAVFLNTLSEYGWVCKHPGKINTVAGLDGRMRRVVVIEGKLWNVDQMAYLCKETGYVMIMGTGHDVALGNFMRWLKSPSEPQPEPAKRNVLPGQKSLFGDES
jgi:hypothetical protein